MSYTFAEKQQMKLFLVGALVYLIFFSCIAWGIVKLLDGSLVEFLWALVFLAVIGFVFSCLRALPSLIFYPGAAWGIMKLLEGGRVEFLWSLIALMGCSCLQFTISSFVWRIYGRRNAVMQIVEAMRENNMPMRAYSTDRMSAYLGCILASGSNSSRIPESILHRQKEDFTAEVLNAAFSMHTTMHTVRERKGMIAEARTWDVMDRALDIYSPLEISPPMVSPSVLYWFRDAATESQIEALPHSTLELAKSIILNRPFYRLFDLHQLLIEHGLDWRQTLDFLFAVSKVSDAWNEKGR